MKHPPEGYFPPGDGQKASQIRRHSGRRKKPGFGPVGYIYDQDTELYYLQSRYYNPVIGRFVNADITVATGQRFIGNNMFPYCINNPTNYLDSEGTDAVWIQEEENVLTMGHTGLLVENEDGDWYFFYWGMESEGINLPNIFAALRGTDAKIVWEKLETNNFDLTKTSGVISALKRSNNKDVDRSNLVTDTIYLEGDYSKTWDYLKNLEKAPPKYNLISNNCVQQSNKALQCSNPIFGLTYAVIPNSAFMNARLANCLKSALDRFIEGMVP